MADNNYNIPKEKFEFVQQNEKLHDKKFQTKPIGYLKDAFNRFKKNKGSLVAAFIVLFLILFAIIGPFCYNADYRNAYETDNDLRRYQYLSPSLPQDFLRALGLDGSGFWDGTQTREITANQYRQYQLQAQETGYNPIEKVLEIYTKKDSNGEKTMYKVLFNNYHNINAFTKTLTQEQYEELQAWQDENEIQIIMPWVAYYDKNSDAYYLNHSEVKYNNINVWYACDVSGNPIDAEGNVVTDISNVVPGYTTYERVGPKNERQGLDDNYTSKMRVAGDPGIENPESTARYKYASTSASVVAGTVNYSYTVRLNAYNYFIYKYDFEPYFLFGSTANGYDVFTRLASGARFSLLFAVAVSAINLFIGAIYGAIEGYYGGAADLIMERVSDILSGIPSMVVTVLFQLHLSGKVGTIPSLLYAFILTGWIGMASRVRMQFYRFKNQEYVLAARTLGAKDARIMFKHIFPNSLGTIITGSVLVIPGVIFSETSLTYLGIINLDSPTRSSVGAMLSAGQGVMTKYPFLVLFPAVFIGLLMVSFNLFGNGLRDAFNPSLRGAEE